MLYPLQLQSCAHTPVFLLLLDFGWLVGCLLFCVFFFFFGWSINVSHQHHLLLTIFTVFARVYAAFASMDSLAHVE